MEIKFSAHGCYRHQYHIVWIPKYRRKVLKAGVKTYIERGFKELMDHYPEVKIIQWNIQIDHVHMIAEIPPKHSVSDIMEKLKSNTARKIRKRFEWIRNLYTKGAFWSPGFFSSTVGLNEKQISRYVEFQEKLDKGTYQLKLSL